MMVRGGGGGKEGADELGIRWLALEPLVVFQGDGGVEEETILLTQSWRDQPRAPTLLTPSHLANAVPPEGKPHAFEVVWRD